MAAGVAEAVKPFPNPRDHPRAGQAEEAAAEAVVGPLVVQGAVRAEQRHRPTEYTVTQSTSSSLLKTFTDGVRVYRLVDRADDGDIYVGYVENAQLADKLLKITSQTNPASAAERE